MKKKTILIITTLVIITITLLFIFTHKTKVNNITFESEKVSRSNIFTTVTATGTLDPVTEVTVGTQVSGIVTKIYVDYNSIVKKGQVIAELDKTTLEAELSSKRANLKSAYSEYIYQLKTYKRYQLLHKKELISQSDYDTALDNYEKAKQAYDIAKNDYAKAKTNLGYATIYSPINGIVLSRAVEAGQTVAASYSTPTLFTIAKNLTDLQVIANVDEADIGNVKNGQRVTFTVDAYPDDTFSGMVKQVRQNATTTNNVVTYQVVISAPNPVLKLKPGLTATITIYTSEKNNVLTVPSKALRFTPLKPLINDNDIVKDCHAIHKLWTRNGTAFIAHPVTIGISNGTRTEIISGINEGANIIIDAVANKTNQSNQDVNSSTDNQTSNDDNNNSSPFMPKHPNKNKK